MTKQHLQHLITDDELQQFNEEGHITVSNALPDELVNRLEAKVDEIYQAHLEAEYDPYTKSQLKSQHNFFYPNFLGRDQAFINLLDWYKTFPKVWGILGWNIYSYHSHFIITPPRQPEERNKPKPLGWHQDSGSALIPRWKAPRVPVCP